MGIEPTTRRIDASMVLKTREATRLQSPPNAITLVLWLLVGNRNRIAHLAQVAVALGDFDGVEIFK